MKMKNSVMPHTSRQKYQKHGTILKIKKNPRAS